MTKQLALFDVQPTPWGQATISVPAPAADVPAEDVPREQRIHWNSREGLAGSKREMGDRARSILVWFRHHPGCTDRQCKGVLFGDAADMNTVRPRITELVDDGLLEEVGRVTDPITQKHVRVIRATQRGMEVEI